MVDERFSVSVHILTILAYREEDLLTSDYLAKSIRTNPTVVRRLVSKMVEAGLLESFKGKAGGVKLSKTAKEISLKDVYKAVSGKQLIPVREKDPLKSCAVSCSMIELLDGIAQGLECQSMKYLDSISINDLTQKVACK